MIEQVSFPVIAEAATINSIIFLVIAILFFVAIISYFKSKSWKSPTDDYANTR